LTNEQLHLIEQYVDVKLYFGSHGTDVDHYLAAEQVFDEIDPATTTLCFENVGYSVHYEHAVRSSAANASTSQRMRMQRESILQSRNSVGSQYFDNLNAFSYAQNFCIANGYDVKFVDLDRWTILSWEKAIRTMGDADNDPILDKEFDKLVKEDWRDLTLSEAVDRYREINRNSTSIINKYGNSPEVVYRWSEQHRIREEAVVRRIKDLALEKAHELSVLSDPSEEKHTIALFFGAAHERGIKMRLANLRIPFNAKLLTANKYCDSASDVPLNGDYYHGFINAFLGSQLWDVYGGYYGDNDPSSPRHYSKLTQTNNAVFHTFSKLPVTALNEFYEAWRNYSKWYSAEQQEGMTILQKELDDLQRNRKYPAAVLQALIGTVCESHGYTISGALNELEFQAERSKRQFNGISE
jgi:hypothetical protein